MVAGAWRWPQYEPAFARGLQAAGVEVVPLAFGDFFRGRAGLVQQAVPLPGPAMYRLNRLVIDGARVHQPDWILFWRPTHLLPNTLRRLRRAGIRTISYNNDDPFGPKAHKNVPVHHHLMWRWYIRCLPLFDLNFFYRGINCSEAIALGARHAEVLMPYFLPWQDRAVRLDTSEQLRYGTDVVFAGHYEPDGRETHVRALIAAGVRVRIWGGPYWTRDVLGDAYDMLAPITPVEGDEYTKALCGAHVCLAFLSKLNRDTYTRRCFEIPACGRVLLAERTDDLQRLFREDEEACFFSSTAELLDRVRWLTEDPAGRDGVAAAGRRRVWADGHDVFSRATWFANHLDVKKAS
jgi:spore maturation protein CgeB